MSQFVDDDTIEEFLRRNLAIRASFVERIQQIRRRHEFDPIASKSKVTQQFWAFGLRKHFDHDVSR